MIGLPVAVFGFLVMGNPPWPSMLEPGKEEKRKKKERRKKAAASEAMEPGARSVSLASHPGSETGKQTPGFTVGVALVLVL